jgi:hypothetical protein
MKSKSTWDRRSSSRLHPRALVKILQQAMRKAFKDTQFHKEFEKFTEDVSTRVMPKTMEK